MVNVETREVLGMEPEKKEMTDWEEELDDYPVMSAPTPELDVDEEENEEPDEADEAEEDVAEEEFDDYDA